MWVFFSFKVWPGDAVFPDFTNLKNTTLFWEKWINYFIDTEKIGVDGLWIVSSDNSQKQKSLILISCLGKRCVKLHA